MRFCLLLAALVVTAGYFTVHPLTEEASADPVRAARREEVRGVGLDGRGLPLAALRARLATRTGELLDPDVLARDREALAEELVARGHLAAEVGAPQVTFDDRGAAFVMFAIAQGPLYRVRSVTVRGASAADAGLVTLGAGDVAVADRLAHARAAIADRLAARGRRAMTVELELRLDRVDAVVDVELVASVAR